MSAQHTPGPWRVGKDKYGRPIIEQVPSRSSLGQTVIAAKWQGGSDCCLEVTEADVRLAAAAPALLKIAQAVMDGYVNLDFDLQSTARDAADAVAKAKGSAA